MQIKELYTNKEEINIYTYLQKCGISNVDLYLDNSYIPKVCNEIALNVVKNGAYYGYIVDSPDGIIL